MMPPELEDWIARIRDRDPMTFEDAYYGDRPTGPDVLPRLINELHQSPDEYTRGKFLELLGEMGDESVVPILLAELAHPNPAVGARACTALECIGSDEAKKAVEEYKAATTEL
jgi:HEAT repeat protein